MKGSENSGQRKKQTAEFSEGKGQRKAAKFSEKNGQRKAAKFSEKNGQRKTAKFSEKKRAAKGSGIQRKKKQAAELLKIPTRTTIICVVPHRPTHRCRLGCRAHLTAGKSVEIMRTDYTVLSVYCGKRSYMNEHEPIKNQT